MRLCTSIIRRGPRGLPIHSETRRTRSPGLQLLRSVRIIRMSSIHGLILEVRVTGGRRLRDTEFFSRQDPYVVLEYATTKHRTRTCTDGGKNPTFDDKFHIPLIEGLREMNISVWNSNTVNHDDFIGSGRVMLQKVLTNGYDDSSWPLQTRNMRSAGEVMLIMHFDLSAMRNKMGKTFAASSTHSVIPPLPMPMPHPHPPALAYAYPAPASSPYPAASAYPTPAHSPYTTYPEYPYGQPYPAPPAAQQSPYGYGYPPAPYPGTYPPRP